MTEVEWLTANCVIELLNTKKARDVRRRRLFGCACARRVLRFLTDKRFHSALDEAERFAAGELDWPGLKTGGRRSALAARKELEAKRKREYVWHAALAVEAATGQQGWAAVELARYAVAAHARPDWDGGRNAEEAAQVAIARDIFGNPFCPVAFDPSWRTDTAVSLAKGMYESRDFAPMPILADALQDAGCESDDLLNHCRDEKATHVRGCWVVDLVLGKS